MNLEQKAITSIEVAEMVKKDHKNILRDVRGYFAELGELKIEPGDFFQSSSYLDGNNQSRPCYLVTKKGCEFIGNKLTGIKGTEFTAKYINRFHEMEDVISNGLEGLSKEIQAIFTLDKKIQSIMEYKANTEIRMDKLEFDIPLYGCESKELSDHVRRKGVQVLGGKKSNAYEDKSLRATVYRDIYDQIKREFGLQDESGRKQTYLALKRKYLADAHECIDDYEAPFYLQEQIEDANKQMKLETTV